MALPLRMNPAKVLIRRLNLSQTTKSSVFKGPSSLKKYDEEETILAQVVMTTEERRNRQLLGNVPFTDGHITYRAPSDATKRLKKGDLIVGLPDGAGGYDTVSYEITENARAGELPNPLIYCAYFKRNEDVVNSP